MHITGIVAEYNPFHAGHRYHVRKAREETGADGIVVVMSGSFVQRGEPAVFDKWTRAGHAIAGGVDLVLELPAVYTLSSAEHFARGAVETLKSTGVLDVLSFGSESGNLSLLRLASAILEAEPPTFRQKLRERLKEGASYAAAQAAALAAVNKEVGTLLQGPNNILAISYLRALGDGAAHTVKRVGSGYLDKEVTGAFPSAMALRERLSRGAGIAEFVSFNAEELPVYRMELYEEVLLYALRVAEWEKYETIPDVIKKRLQDTEMTSLQDVLESAKTKNIAMSAIKRALLQILLQNTLSPALPPAYIRVLGFSERGAEILKKMKNNASLPVITRPAAYKENCPIWELEKRATDIYFLPMRKSGQDLLRPPVQQNNAEKEKTEWTRH